MNENKGINPAVQAGSANQGKGGRHPVRIVLGVIVALVIYFLSRQSPPPHHPTEETPQPTATVAVTQPAQTPAAVPNVVSSQPAATVKPAVPSSNAITQPVGATTPPASVSKVAVQPVAATAKPASTPKVATQPALPKTQASAPSTAPVQAVTTTARAVTAQAQPAKNTSQTAQNARVFKARWHKSNLERHWEKHHAEFPEYHSAKEYGDAALELFEYPPPGTLRKQKENGDRLFYHPPTNRFGVTAEDGTPKTMFKPDRGIQYWNKQ